MQTASIASNVQPPANTESRLKSRCQFNCQRESIQSDTQFSNGAGVCPGQLEVRSGGLRPLQKQVHGCILRQRLTIWEMLQIWQRKRGHGKLVFSTQVQYFTAGDKYLQIRTS